MTNSLEQLFQVGADMRVVLVIGVMIFGAISCFYGYKIFKIVLGILGFVVGGGVVAGIAASLVQDSAMVFVAGLVGGVILGALMVKLYKLGLFILGATAGSLVGGMGAIVLGLHGNAALVVVVVMGLLAGILTTILQKLMVISSTAFSGSWNMVAGVAFFLFGISPITLIQNPHALVGMRFLVLVAGWLVLGIAGVTYQYRGRVRKGSTVAANGSIES